MDDTMEEEEMLASPSPVASPNTVCTRCPVLEKKSVFYQKKISWLRRSRRKLEDRSTKVNNYCNYCNTFC